MAEELKYAVTIDFTRARESWRQFVEEMRQQSRQLAAAVSSISQQLAKGQLPLDAQALVAPIRDAANNLIALSGSLKQLGSTLAEQAPRAESTTSAFSRLAAQLKATFSATELVKASFTTLGLGLGAYGVVQAVRQISAAAAEFDRYMREVWTLLDMTEAQFESFAANVVDLSRRIPLSTTELAKGIYWALSAGIPKENVLTFVTEAAKAALAGVTSLKNTVDVITTVLNSYGYAATEVSRINDILFKGTAIAKTTFEELVTAIGPILPVAAQLDVSVEEVVAALGALSNMGMSTARAATYINQALVRILSPTREAIETARQLGIQFDSTAIKAMGFSNYLKYLKETVGDNEEALANLFENVRAMRAVFSLVSEQGMRIFTNMLEQVRNAAGSTEVAFQKMTSSLANEWQKLKNTLSSVFKSEAMREFLRDVVRFLNDVASAMLGTQNASAQLKSVLETSFEMIERYRMSVSQLANTFERLTSLEQYLRQSTQDLQKSYQAVLEALSKYNDVLGAAYLARYGVVQLGDAEEKMIRELSALYPELADAISLVGTSYYVNKNKLVEFMETQARQMELQLKYIEMNIRNYKLESDRWQEQTRMYEEQIRQAKESIAQLETIRDTYVKFSNIAGETLRAQIEAGLKQLNIASVKELHQLEWALLWLMSRGYNKEAMEKSLQIENIQRTVVETLIGGMISTWEEVASIVMKDMPEEGRRAVQTLNNELRRAYRESQKGTAEGAWKTFRSEFRKLLEQNQNLLGQIPADLAQPLMLFYQAIFKDYSDLRDIMEAIMQGYYPVRGQLLELEARINESRYQVQELERLKQEVDLQNQRATIGLETYQAAYETLNKGIKNFTEQIQQLKTKSEETLMLEAALDRVKRETSRTLSQTESLLAGIARLMNTQIEDVKRLGVAALQLPKGVTLEDLASTYGDTANELYKTIVKQLQSLEQLDVSQLSAESKQVYDQLKNKLIEYRDTLEHITRVLDVKEILQRYRITQGVLDTTQVTDMAAQLVTDFGVNLIDLVSTVSKGATTVNEALKNVKEALIGAISKTGKVSPKTAEEIAEKVSSTLLEFANTQTREYSTALSQAIQKATAASTLREKIVSLAQLLKMVQTGEDLKTKLVQVFGEELTEVIAGETMQNAILQVNRAFQEAVVEAAREGINIDLLLEDTDIAAYVAAVIAQLKAQYNERVQNFRQQIEKEYNRVFGKEMVDLQQAIQELMIKAETDETVKLWLQRISTLVQSIRELGNTLNMLGENVDVITDVGGYLTDFGRTLKTTTSDIAEFKTGVGNWKVALELLASPALWSAAASVEELRNSMNRLIDEGIRALHSNLLEIYYEVKQNEGAFAKYAETLKSIGIESTAQLEQTIISLFGLVGATEYVRHALEDVASAINTLGVQINEALENLPKDVNAFDVLFGRRGDIQEMKSTLSQLETLLERSKKLQNELIASRERLNHYIEQLPEEVKGPLGAYVSAFDQLASVYDEKLKEFEGKTLELGERYTALVNEVFDYIEGHFEKMQQAIATGDYLTLANILAELSKVDVNAIPLNAEVRGKTGLQLRKELAEVLDLIRNELDKFKNEVSDSVTRLKDRISIVNLIRQYVVAGDTAGLITAIDDLIRVPQLTLVKRLAELAQDPQLRQAYTDLANRIETDLKALKEQVIRNVISFALSGIPVDVAIPLGSFEKLEELLREMIAEQQALGESTDELEELLARVSSERVARLSEIAKQEEEIRREILKQRLENIESTARFMLDNLARATKHGVEQLKHEYDALHAWLRTEMENIAAEYPEFAEDVSNAFKKLFDTLAREEADALQDVAQSWMDALESQVKYMATLAEDAIHNYSKLLDVFITLSDEIEAFKTRLETAGLLDKYQARLHELQEEIRSLIQVDLARSLNLYDVTGALGTIARILNVMTDYAKDLEARGVSINELFESVAEQLAALFRGLPGLNLPQAFEQTVFAQLADALAKSLTQAWVEAMRKGELVVEDMGSVMQFAGKYLRENLSTAASYAAASLLMSADSIVNALQRVGLVGTEIGEGIIRAVEGAKIGWYIGQQVANVLTSSSWVVPTFTIFGGLLTAVFGFIFRAIEEQRRKAEELQRRIEELTQQLQGTFASAITSAFEEANLEGFKNRLEKSMLQAIRDALIKAVTDKILAQYTAQLASIFVGPEGQLRIPTAAELQNARVMIEQIAIIAQQWYEQFRYLFPELYSESVEWSAASATRTITEETANRLVGLFSTLTTYVYQIKRVIVDGESAVKVQVVNATGAEYYRSKGVI